MRRTTCWFTVLSILIWTARASAQNAPKQWSVEKALLPSDVGFLLRLDVAAAGKANTPLLDEVTKKWPLAKPVASMASTCGLDPKSVIQDLVLAADDAATTGLLFIEPQSTNTTALSLARCLAKIAAIFPPARATSTSTKSRRARSWRSPRRPPTSGC